MVRLRKPLPPYALKTPEGGKVYLPDLKGKPLVLLRSEALAQGLAAREAELKALEAPVSYTHLTLPTILRV